VRVQGISDERSVFDALHQNIKNESNEKEMLFMNTCENIRLTFNSIKYGLRAIFFHKADWALVKVFKFPLFFHFLLPFYMFCL